MMREALASRERVRREAPQPPRKRRLGGWHPRVPLGDGGAARVWHAARGDLARHTVLARIRDEDSKGCGRRGVESINVTGRVHLVHRFESVFGEYTVGCSRPGKEGGRAGSNRAAGRRRAGRSVPTGKEHRSSRVTPSLRDFVPVREERIRSCHVRDSDRGRRTRWPHLPITWGYLF